jgi:hypothetical protein
MAKCPYCNIVENDYNNIVHYADKLNYFVVNSKKTKCFRCSKVFLITASSPHFYDKMVVKNEDFERIIAEYYLNNNLENYLPTNSIKKLYLICLNETNKNIKQIALISLFHEYLKQTKDLQANKVKNEFLKLTSSPYNINLINSLIKDYQSFIKYKTIELSYSSNKYFKLISVIFTYKYKHISLLNNLKKNYKKEILNLQKELSSLIKALK